MEATRRNVLRILAVGAGVAGAATISPSALAAYGNGAALRESTAQRSPHPGRLTGRLVFPDDADYDNARLGWNRQFSPYPLVIVFCQDAQDVINAITWCRRHDVAFRARGGRHALEGWSAVDGGVIIDVSDMQEVEVDTRARQVTVQTGVTQDQVVEVLGERGFAIPTGAEVGVGVAGVTLGGGIGQLCRSLGVTSDSLMGLDIVIPEGERGARLVRADETQHADLLWASRGGGGGNFGIATSYTFRIHPVSDVVVYQITWDDWRQLGRLFRIWQEIAPFADDGFGSVFNPKTRADGHIYCNGIYRGSEYRLREIVQPLLDVGDPQVTMETMSYLDAWNELAGTTDPPRKTHIPSAWVYDLLPDEGIDAVYRHLAELPDLGGEVWCLNWGGAVNRIPTDATAFFHRRPKYYMEWSGNWETDGEQKVVLSWTEQFRQALLPYVKGSYVNVPDSSIGDWATAYYGDNYARLRRIKTTYDPYEFFQYEQSIRPY
ncbi:FAD-binding oxidoreductase [Salinispora arenicola]|uniref:FAD-binding protein n=1 Tax=Salinispora arenicola TaxID=168697 RepID=A0A542XLM7_SALAC|nr:FAD-binding oxidoreductase [Salinispora arenicola]MCN0152932.1 FAD-binding oxidoreductase [Salinispora arenicola]TQL36755.1 FAD/FMN-containing dehydrogenase [Salinispora arenicola]GIM87172.1 FAD-binding protein [Salinispora arenicola]